ncbi:DUF3300 domain-containing protein [Mycobacterium sp. KBS0706]|uniref:DUF3300 domain-containing protein n=1 Tax=Mycobacterium sp. KBS0706 TaxID=2578109 RepID=UPI00110FBC18|nr:DUF3300 domain-containing protein [Mycobacterium sp. KBS0706]TSD84008.1 DUF3300 domain-containing protein [Mycobacterium sp. KBS0706]
MSRAQIIPKPDASSRRERLRRLQLMTAAILALAAAQLLEPPPAAAQTVTPTAVAGAAQTPDLRVLVARIALYPDDVLSLVLPASTATLDVVEAVRFLGKRQQDSSLTPDPTWDPSVIALLNYPEALKLMDSDLDWTTQLGQAVTDNLESVLDAIQAIRSEAMKAGYLASNEQVSVVQTVATTATAGSAEPITITSTDPDVAYVPAYDPGVVVNQGYAAAAPITYPQPYLNYQYPAAPFFTGLLFGTAVGYGMNWDDDDIDIDFNDVDFDDINWDNVDWDKVDRVRSDINGDVNFNNFVNNGVLKNTDRTALQSRINENRQNFRGAHDRMGDSGQRRWQPDAGAAGRLRQNADRPRRQAQGLAPTQRAAAEGLRQRQGANRAGTQRQRVGQDAARRGNTFGGVQPRRETGRASTRGRESLDLPRRPSAGSPGRPTQRQMNRPSRQQSPAFRQQRSGGSRAFGGVSSGSRTRMESNRGHRGGGGRAMGGRGGGGGGRRR